MGVGAEDPWLVMAGQWWPLYFGDIPELARQSPDTSLIWEDTPLAIPGYDYSDYDTRVTVCSFHSSLLMTSAWQRLCLGGMCHTDDRHMKPTCNFTSLKEAAQQSSIGNPTKQAPTAWAPMYAGPPQARQQLLFSAWSAWFLPHCLPLSAEISSLKRSCWPLSVVSNSTRILHSLHYFRKLFWILVYSVFLLLGG